MIVVFNKYINKAMGARARKIFSSSFIMKWFKNLQVRYYIYKIGKYISKKNVDIIKDPEQLLVFASIIKGYYDTIPDIVLEPMTASIKYYNGNDMAPTTARYVYKDNSVEVDMKILKKENNNITFLCERKDHINDRNNSVITHNTVEDYLKDDIAKAIILLITIGYTDILMSKLKEILIV